MKHRSGPDDSHQSLFILSTGDRDGIADLVRDQGWQAIAVRRRAGAVQRYLAGDALIALVDIRNVKDPLPLIGPLAPAVEASGGGLIALMDANRLDQVPELTAIGVTHVLSDPVTPDALRAALACAQAMTDRLGGGVAQARRARRIRRGDSLFWHFDPRTRRVRLSEALARTLSLPTEAMNPAALLRRVPRADRAMVAMALRGMIRTGRLASFVHGAPGGGADRMVHHPRISDGVVVGDVEWLAEGHHRDMGARDYLTGLRTRQDAMNWIETHLVKDMTLLSLSISQFDRMNAAYGQVAGDALLGRIARRVERMVDEVTGPGPIVARVAGTEYLVALTGDHAAPERAIFLARRILSAISRPFNAGDHLIRLTARCGIAQSRPGDDALHLMRRAGMALADAKQAGGEGIRILTADHRSRQVDTDQLETDLRLALNRGEIGIVFQPQYPVDQQRIVGVEALARWNHPKYGPLGAGILFATAERSDYMLPLSAHIQEQALRQAANWPAALSSLRLSINVTAADIAQPDFMANLLGMVDRCGFPRARLTVEITESGLIEDIDAATTLLAAMRAEGLAVAIDDFGTGYSSLAYLKSLPLDYLKIDSGLAQDIAGSARDRIIVRGVIHMAKSLGLKVIAEGVETEQQLDLLANEGCDMYQGFLRSPGVSSTELVALVSG